MCVSRVCVCSADCADDDSAESIARNVGMGCRGCRTSGGFEIDKAVLSLNECKMRAISMMFQHANRPIFQALNTYTYPPPLLPQQAATYLLAVCVSPNKYGIKNCGWHTQTRVRCKKPHATCLNIIQERDAIGSGDKRACPMRETIIYVNACKTSIRVTFMATFCTAHTPPQPRRDPRVSLDARRQCVCAVFISTSRLFHLNVYKLYKYLRVCMCVLLCRHVCIHFMRTVCLCAHAARVNGRENADKFTLVFNVRKSL